MTYRETRRLARRAKQLLEDGMSWNAIVELFNTEGIKTTKGNQWDEKRLNNLVYRNAHKPIRIHKGKSVKSAEPQDAVNARMARARAGIGKKKVVPNGDADAAVELIMGANLTTKQKMSAIKAIYSNG